MSGPDLHKSPRRRDDKVLRLGIFLGCCAVLGMVLAGILADRATIDATRTFVARQNLSIAHSLRSRLESGEELAALRDAWFRLFDAGNDIEVLRPDGLLTTDFDTPSARGTNVAARKLTDLDGRDYLDILAERQDWAGVLRDDTTWRVVAIAWSPSIGAYIAVQTSEDHVMAGARAQSRRWVTALACCGALLLLSIAALFIAHRRARRAWRHSQDVFQVLVENVRDVFWLMDLHPPRMRYVNEMYEEIWGQPRATLYADPHAWLAALHPDDRALVRPGYQTPDARTDLLYRIVRPDGAVRWVQSQVNPIFDADGKPIALTGVARDVTDLLEARRARDESSAGFEALVNACPDPIRIAREGTIVLANAAAAKYLGYERVQELVGTGAVESFPPEQRVAMSRAMEQIQGGGPSLAHEVRLLRRDGSTVEVESVWFGITVGGERVVVMISRDLTQRRMLEQKIMFADRMASIGTLAAGVAHEINNPLAYVTVNLDQAIELTKERPDVGEVLAEARVGADRIRDVVRDLKTFSRPAQGGPGTCDLGRVIESALSMASNEIRHRARLVRDLASVPPVAGDESKLGQVFLNLIVNAAQAIPEGDVRGHEIRVSTREEGGWVIAEVRDNGVGIPAAHLAQVFDPFFTTKPVGVGTGLGLSISKQIIEAIGGTISIESTPGVGTAVRVSAPASARAPAERASAPESPARRGRVLVVDDEVLIARALVRVLRNEHDVEIATSARDALAKITASPTYDVILCDLMMPDMTGMDLHAELCGLAPAQAAHMVFLSGGAFTPRARDFLATVENPRLDKPFSPDHVRGFLRGLIRRFDQGTPRAA